MSNYRLQVGTRALSDHMDRLYGDEGKFGTMPHIDGAASGTIKVVKSGDRVCTVIISVAAIREFVSDMEYQAAVCEDSDQRAYRTQCARAAASIRKQMWHLFQEGGK